MSLIKKLKIDKNKEIVLRIFNKYDIKFKGRKEECESEKFFCYFFQMVLEFFPLTEFKFGNYFKSLEFDEILKNIIDKENNFKGQNINFEIGIDNKEKFFKDCEKDNFLKDKKILYFNFMENILPLFNNKIKKDFDKKNGNFKHFLKSLKHNLVNFLLEDKNFWEKKYDNLKKKFVKTKNELKKYNETSLQSIIKKEKDSLEKMDTLIKEIKVIQKNKNKKEMEINLNFINKQLYDIKKCLETKDLDSNSESISFKDDKECFLPFQQIIKKIYNTKKEIFDFENISKNNLNDSEMIFSEKIDYDNFSEINNGIKNKDSFEIENKKKKKKIEILEEVFSKTYQESFYNKKNTNLEILNQLNQIQKYKDLLKKINIDLDKNSFENVENKINKILSKNKLYFDNLKNLKKKFLKIKNEINGFKKFKLSYNDDFKKLNKLYKQQALNFFEKIKIKNNQNFIKKKEKRNYKEEKIIKIINQEKILIKGKNYNNLREENLRKLIVKIENTKTEHELLLLDSEEKIELIKVKLCDLEDDMKLQSIDNQSRENNFFPDNFHDLKKQINFTKKMDLKDLEKENRELVKKNKFLEKEMKNLKKNDILKNNKNLRRKNSEIHENYIFAQKTQKSEMNSSPDIFKNSDITDYEKNIKKNERESLNFKNSQDLKIPKFNYFDDNLPNRQSFPIRNMNLNYFRIIKFEKILKIVERIYKMIDMNKLDKIDLKISNFKIFLQNHQIKNKIKKPLNYISLKNTKIKDIFNNQKLKRKSIELDNEDLRKENHELFIKYENQRKKIKINENLVKEIFLIFNKNLKIETNKENLTDLLFWKKSINLLNKKLEENENNIFLLEEKLEIKIKEKNFENENNEKLFKEQAEAIKLAFEESLLNIFDSLTLNIDNLDKKKNFDFKNQKVSLLHIQEMVEFVYDTLIRFIDETLPKFYKNNSKENIGFFDEIENLKNKIKNLEFENRNLKLKNNFGSEENSIILINSDNRSHNNENFGEINDLKILNNFIRDFFEIFKNEPNLEDFLKLKINFEKKNLNFVNLNIKNKKHRKGSFTSSGIKKDLINKENEIILIQNENQMFSMQIDVYKKRINEMEKNNDEFLEMKKKLKKKISYLKKDNYKLTEKNNEFNKELQQNKEYITNLEVKCEEFLNKSQNLNSIRISKKTKNKKKDEIILKKKNYNELLAYHQELQNTIRELQYSIKDFQRKEKNLKIKISNLKKSSPKIDYKNLSLKKKAEYIVLQNEIRQKNRYINKLLDKIKILKNVVPEKHFNNHNISSRYSLITFDKYSK